MMIIFRNLALFSITLEITIKTLIKLAKMIVFDEKTMCFLFPVQMYLKQDFIYQKCNKAIERQEVFFVVVLDTTCVSCLIEIA